jgi:cytoskeletal protein CcmA (bactofilin family)
MFGSRDKQEESKPAPKGTHDTIVGTGCKVKGDLTVRGSILIRGEVEGAIQATDDVLIELGARVRGEVRGKIEGNVKVRDSLELQEGARLQGDVYARSFRIQDGAIFQGNCHMGKEVEKPNLPGAPEVTDR